MPLLKKLFLGTGVVTAGVGAWAVSRPKPAPFHVDNVPPVVIKAGGINIFPLIQFVGQNLPESTRRKFVSKMGAPRKNEMKDRYDCLKESPYTIAEIVPDKLWRIGYQVTMDFVSSPEARQQAKAFGMDPENHDYAPKVLSGAAQFGDKAVEVAKNDIQKAVDMFAMESISDAQLMDLCPWSLNSYVVKLKNGGLLLYAPVKIREETGFAQWLDSLGRVEWIVIASGAHTLNIQPVVARYPDARIIGPPQAEAKLNVISALPKGKVDYDSTKASDLAAVNQLLIPKGVRLHNVDGDVCTNALVAVVDDEHLLECDLMYSHADGGGFLHISKERFEKFLPEDCFMRLFRYTTMAKPNSPAGFLPAYRYQLMDANSLGAMLYDQPAWDGSSCRTMANSLRDVVKSSFFFAHGVHFDTMDRETFIDGLDKNWNWLDGKSL